MPESKLSDKPWNQLSQQEKQAWREAAEIKGPVLFGGAKVEAQAYRDTVVRSWRRGVRHTY